ncbi:biotin/lipoyl-containing protein [Niameybacter massiliensis]|uniref:biotin/lipoyl-containing protein n=1 Tax=Niameybacter massiliensis TaxID=1658108 RepID=UPI0006B67203|nr:biotin/lipoyl-containing protein [Niameybacter massiliensis]
MKKYKVNVNGTDYEITVELLGEVPSQNISSTSSASSTSPSNVSPTPSTNSSVTKITSPMPGTLLAINVSLGVTVKKGDTLMILEAMKMENEILAPKDGKICALHFTKGATVESGTLLCEIQ